MFSSFHILIFRFRRKKNFTIEEKNVFLNLLKREKSIWEYKTEGCTESSKKLKSEAWTRVCKKFNSFEGFTKVSY